MTEIATAPAADGQPPPKWLEWPTAYMDHVAHVCASPGGRSDLQTGLTRQGRREPWQMLPHVRSRIPQHGEETKLAYLVCAAMFADQAANPALATTAAPQSTYAPAHGNFGWSMARAVERGVFTDAVATEQLQIMARQRTLEGLLRHLQPAVRRLASAHVPLSWPRLLKDLTSWRGYRLKIADQWMHGRFAPTRPAIDDEITKELSA